MGHHCSRVLDLVLGHNYLGTIRAFQFLYLNSVLELCLRIICHTIKAESHGDILQSTVNPEGFQSAWQEQEIISKHLLNMVSSTTLQCRHTHFVISILWLLAPCLSWFTCQSKVRETPGFQHGALPCGTSKNNFQAESWCVTLSVPSVSHVPEIAILN